MSDDAGTGGQKLYEIIRDQLIDDITSGRAYPPGALLPSVREITVKWTVSTTTARKVLSELVNAGYARAEGTRGHVSTGPRGHPTSDSTNRSGFDSAQLGGRRQGEQTRKFEGLDIELGRSGDPHPNSSDVGLGRLRDVEVIIWQLTALPWRARAAAIRAAREEEAKIAAERESETRRPQ
ncbi:MAG TPA: GntR family transcriptional regulator [Streptosporangiaceae bacterium]|nr:GntR family transcriptional regulator [Streptosporangiaceae bacterium]